MQTLLPQIWIFAVSLVSGVMVGMGISGIMSARRMKRIEQDSWNAARVFYRHRYGIDQRQ